MTEPLSRRQTLQLITAHVRLILALPLAPFFSSCLQGPSANTMTERPKGETMNQASSPGVLDPYRLPRHVVPTRYDLRLEPDLTTASFAGQETITITVHQPTSDIVLNAIDLDIASAKIDGESGPAREATIASDVTLQRCHLTCAETL